MNGCFKIITVLMLLAMLQPLIQAEDIKPTWNDLVLALNRFEKALEAHPVPGEKLAAFNREVDKAIPRHATAQMGRVIQAVDALTASLDSAAATPAARRAASLRVRVTPRAFVIGSEAAPMLHIAALYGQSAETKTALTLRVTFPGEAGSVEIPFEVRVGDISPVALTIPLGEIELEPGACAVELVTPEGYAVAMPPWYLVSQSLGNLREANSERLETIEAESRVIEQALAACRSRNNLLLDEPSERRLIEFLTDPVQLAGDLESEIASLEKGQNPFKLRKGDYWRTIVLDDDVTIPVRIYAPAAIENGTPLPLVIAFSGIKAALAADIEGFGAGRLAKLADEKGFVLAAPGLRFVPSGPQRRKRPSADDIFDRLVEILQAEYPIALDRVLILGHATGGLHATNAGKANLDTVVAVCCISSGSTGYSIQERIPPTLLMTGSEDRVAPPNRVGGQAMLAQARKLPVYYHEIKDFGRVLAAGQGFAHAIDWLLAQKRESSEEE